MNSSSYWPFSEYMLAPSTKLLAAFVTAMPTAFTSVGSRPCTCEMRFCTSTAAMSMLWSTSNVTLIEQVPSLPLLDDM